jgi:hypothetical protein
MILIITEKNDIPSHQVIALMQNQNISHKVIFTDEKDINVYVNISANDEVTIFIEDNPIETFSAVWFRRTNFYSYLFIEEKVPNNIQYEISEYLSYEKKILFEFILKYLHQYAVNTIGNPIFSTNNVNKLEILCLAKECGFQIPQTEITNLKRNLQHNHNLISKPIGEIFFRQIENEFYQSSTTFVDTLANEIADNFFYSLFQENVTKKIELKVIFFNRKTYSVAYFTQMKEDTLIDSRNFQFENDIKITPFQIPCDIEDKLNFLFDRLNLNFGVVDFIIDDNNNFIFLELNPVGQFHDIVTIGNYSLYHDIFQFLQKQ